jgi:putative peptidoglycan lipid II flippase
VAPGFDAATRELYTSLFRIMCITPVLFAASIALGEVLVAERRFVYYGLAPLLYNLGIVVGTLLFIGEFGIYAAAIGAVLGAALHLAIRVVGITRTSFHIRARFSAGTRAFREFVRLFLPKSLSSPVEPLTFLFFTRVASGLAAGSITTVNLARNFQSVPVSLIGVAFSVAAFPALSATYATGDRGAFTRLVRSNVLVIGVLTTLAAIGLAVVGPLAIEVFFAGGRFDADDVARTALILTVFAISIPFESLGHLLSRAIYATRHTLWQVVATLIGFAVTIVATLATVDVVGAAAIPLGFSMGAFVRFALLAVVLASRIRSMPTTPTHLIDEALPAPAG